ncbi:amino acid ABC transporter substrate-binding protein [Enterococcus sp. OL5]|uniref:amino acid ABC transporter substrate-binding protein n=1 Tax=Enterococcus sp. OL5 TaxID=2590214 RepID=UPI00112D36A4|nr:amino acid ABC transporter substrate-binding protein [Enterococcus sp. OL5]TPR55118.1 amino acid ABC transporter substrate-binding protein [Enterococcus sp. OL5]
MKKRKIAFITLAGVVLLSACGKQAASQSTESSTSTAAEATVIKVGSTGQSFPNGYKEDNKLVGFDVELTEKIAEQLGYQVEWVTTDFSGLMAQLEGGRLDTVANAVAITAERAEKYTFAEPYSFYGVQLVTNVENKDINTPEDLKGKTVSGVLGSNNVKNLEKFDTNKEITIRTYETRDGAQQDVINNRVEGYVNSRPILAAEIKKSKLPLKFVGEPLTYEDVSFPFAKNEKGEKLAKEFSKEIEELRASGELKTLSEKYFDEDITTKTKE